MTGLVINHQLESITPTSSDVLHLGGAGGLILPVGGTAARPTNLVGFLRYNSQSGAIEIADGTTWTTLGSGAVNYLVAGAGLSGGTIINLGTIAVQINGVAPSMLAQRAAVSIMGNPLGTTANVQDITLGTGLTFSGGTAVALDVSGVTAGTYNSPNITVDAYGRIVTSTNAANRIRLTTNLTLYVSPTGNDSNAGTSAGSPFLTILKAINTISYNYDLNGYAATVQLADGTYPGNNGIRTAFVGAVTQPDSPNIVTINGNAGTPANVHITSSSNSLFSAQGEQIVIALTNLKMSTSGGGNDCLISTRGSVIALKNVIFGSCGQYHIHLDEGGIVHILDSYSIIGGAIRHISLTNHSIVFSEHAPAIISLSGTPNFSSSFISTYNCSNAVFRSSFSGAATGTRFANDVNSILNTNGAGLNYFPGNAAGSSTNGSQYD